MTRIFATILLLLTGTAAYAQNSSIEPIPRMPKLLSQREQADIREQWLKKRLGSRLLPMMKRHGIGMWIVVNEEFHADPVTPHIVPPIPIVGRRDLFVFIDQGERIERVAVLRYAEERLKNHYRMLLPARDKFGEELKKLVDGRNPKTIALNIGGTRGQQSGLTYDGYKFLAETLGPENEKKFVSAANLLTEFFDTRLPEELEHYHTAVLATDVITRRAFSNEVITPGRTTAGDVRWWMLTRLSKLGNGRIRKALYFPAITAIKHNVIVKSLANRLSQKGKAPMQVICAAMQKLLHLAFGVIKSNRPFDPKLAFHT